MEFVVLWLACGGIAALIAFSKGGTGWIGFLVGLLLGPLGIIVAFFLGSEHFAADQKIASGQKKKCPRCAELVQPDALVCKHCGHEFAAAASTTPTITAAPIVPARAEALPSAAGSGEREVWVWTALGVMIVAGIAFLTILAGNADRKSASLQKAPPTASVSAEELADKLEAGADELERMAAAPPPASKSRPSAIPTRPAVKMCFKDYCPCKQPQGGPDSVLCDQLEQGIEVDNELMIAGRGMREARRQMETGDY